MRVDVRQITESAARAEREHHNIYIALVSGELVEASQDWSEPVRVKFVPDQKGIVEILVKRA